MGKKRTKGKSVSLAEFLGTENSDGNSAVVIAPKSSYSEEEERYATATERIVLPTAPRQARGPNIDMERVPKFPPFIAYVANLPFEVEDYDIERFFGNLTIKSIRLPREGGEHGRFKGFGYVEFENRKDLLDALEKHDDNMRNRKIRVDIAEEEGSRKESSSFSREDHEARSDGVSDWRSSRNTLQSEKYGSRRTDNKYGDATYRRNDEGSYRRNEDSSYRRNDYNLRDSNMDNRTPPRERKKLNLKPRSIPVEASNINKPEPASSSIFGSAKPVDTASKEKEIEEKISKRSCQNIDTSYKEEKLHKRPQPPQKESKNSDIFGAAKPVDTTAREREIEDRLTKQDKMRPSIMTDKNKYMNEGQKLKQSTTERDMEKVRKPDKVKNIQLKDSATPKEKTQKIIDIKNKFQELIMEDDNEE